MDWPYRNFATDVAEGKKRWHVRSKTQLHVLPGLCSSLLSLVLRDLPRSTYVRNLYSALIFWFFYIKVKEQ
jgi:hypothetical protein